MEKISFRKHSIDATWFVIVVSALFGGIVGVGIFVVGTATAAVLTGPLGWFFLLPAVLAHGSVALTWVLIGVPLWAVFGGMWFAGGMCGANGTIARAYDITFFTKFHPVFRRAQGTL